MLYSNYCITILTILKIQYIIEIYLNHYMWIHFFQHFSFPLGTSLNEHYDKHGRTQEIRENTPVNEVSAEFVRSFNQ